MDIEVKTKDKIYNVSIGKLREINANGKVLIVTNPRVCGLHIATLLKNLSADEVYVCTIKDGEAHKNLKTIEEILDNAFIHKLDRKSLIIAFGGGVIGDMAGFAAGIYQRGIDVIQIPTTLLAQVDASVGGKTGVNNAFGKNLIGVFHQPRAVFIDPSFLETLPRREFIAGISEIIKVAVCFDKEFFEFLERADLLNNKDDLTRAISRSIEIKAEVVSKDEKENGIRAGLNYGHTFGHIIELFGEYKTFLHGEAVSLGMIYANNLALKLNLIESSEAKRIKDLLNRFELPTDYRAKNPDEFYAHFFLDKKSRHDRLRFVLANGIGKMKIIENPPRDILMSIL